MSYTKKVQHLFLKKHTNTWFYIRTALIIGSGLFLMIYLLVEQISNQTL